MGLGNDGNKTNENGKKLWSECTCCGYRILPQCAHEMAESLALSDTSKIMRALMVTFSYYAIMGGAETVIRYFTIHLNRIGMYADDGIVYLSTLNAIEGVILSAHVRTHEPKMKRRHTGVCAYA